MNKLFPTLYKKTSTGKIQMWSVSVQGSSPSGPASIVTRFGQVDGKVQETSDIISEGKNVGRSNETTPWTQAVAEAESNWTGKKKKGYVETSDDASSGKVDAVIEGGVSPMLAHSFDDHGHKIIWPAYGQRKLDGIRCVAILKNGTCTLWTRSRKRIASVPHIEREIEKLFGDRDLTLDGELYNQAYAQSFETIVSLVRQDEPAPDSHLVQYHVYDLVTSGGFSERMATLQALLQNLSSDSPLKLVETVKLENKDNVSEYLAKFIEDGYEGLMIRNAAGQYVGKRSYDLLKAKTFQDSEFKIVDIEEGRGKLAGHVGGFVCEMPNGQKFVAKMAGSLDRLRDYFQNHSLWKDKLLTVKYQGLTNTNGVPRFPVGIAIRSEYE